MSAIKGAKSTALSKVSSVEAIKVTRPVKYGHGFYAVDVRIKVQASTPADAALHAQSEVLR
jgi:hypothetical protein